MKKCLSIVLIVVLLFSSLTILAHAETVDLAESNAISTERQKVVDYMMSMATIKWKCGKYFCTVHDEYYEGNTYYGIPYSWYAAKYDVITLERFKDLIKDGKTIDGCIGRNDCSSTVSLSMRQVDKTVYGQSCTPDMRPGVNGFVKVGSYEWVNTSGHQTDKTATCKKNGRDVMFAAYAQMLPGDALCIDGHAMMIMSNNPKTQTVTITHQSHKNFKYDPKTNKTTRLADRANGYPRNSSWGINESLEYKDLFNSYCVPLTCSVLAKSSPSTVTKPSAPSSVSFKSTSLGKGDTLVASWGKVSGATKYNVKVFYNGKQKESKSITGTSYSYKANDEGTYYVTVSASNSAGTSSEKKSGNATVYPNYTVKWVDYDGSVIKTQTVKYGGNGTNPPANPVREGYTFQNWQGSANNIKANTTITATYKINTYSVTFVDYNGSTIGSVQRVDYGKSATAPENVPVQAGYKFIGWNTEDYKSVTKSMTVSAVYEWENTDLPIGMNITSAKRNEEGTGYVVTVDLNNFPNDFTKGKIVVALKTDAGKMVASETRTISLPENNNCTERITVLYSGLVKNVEVSMVGVVDDETTGTPKAKTVKSAVDIGNEWSDWSPNQPAEGLMSESRTEYRYKDSKTIRATTKPATPAGFTFVNSALIANDYTGWSAWSAYSTKKETTSALKEQGTTKGYRYYAFVCSSCGQRDPYSGKCSKCGKTGTLSWNEMYYEKIGSAVTSGAGSWDSTRGYCTINGKRWTYEKPGCSNGAGGTGQPTTTMYRYRTRQQYSNYNYIQTNFSNWQTDPVSASSTRQVETRTTYRFKSNNIEIPCYNYKRYKYTNLSTGKAVFTYSSAYPDSMDYPGEWEYNTSFTELNLVSTIDDGIGLYNGYGEDSWYKADVNAEGTSTVYETVKSLEDGEGVQRHLEGTLENAPNKVVTLLVYKGQNTDPTANQIEFIGQTTTDETGFYSFDYITKEEPSVTTGDFVITVGAEGSTNYQTVGKIEAPKPVYSVEFFLPDGTHVGTSNVVAGGAAEAPEAPAIEGYEFIGWDTALKNIQENTVVEAVYREKTCVVVFVEWDESFVSLKELPYGSELTSDVIPEQEAKMFEYWSLADDTPAQIVTDNMIVTAKYKDAVYVVTFFDADGNVLSEQELGYGEEALAPVGCEAPSPKMTFARWDSEGEEEYVTRSMAIHPEFKYVEDSDCPRFTIETGYYAESQTVGIYSLAANTKIYYLVMENNPSIEGIGYLSEDLLIEYEAPIKVDESSIICAYAISPDKNRSEIVAVSLYIGEEQPTEPSTEEPTLAPTEPPTVVSTDSTEAETIILGDVDGDGVVSIIDATTIQKVRASIPVNSFNEIAADVDGDGIVSVIDATYIQKWLAHIEISYDIGTLVV